MSAPSLRGRLERWLLLPLLGLLLINGAVSYAITRHYADRVYDRWLYDSANSLAQQVRLIGGRLALELPRAAQEMFEWDDEDQTLFQVTGSRSGHIAGVADGPATDRAAVRFRNARFFDAVHKGRPMRWAALDTHVSTLEETVTVMVGETTHKRTRLADEVLLSVWLPQFALLLLVAWVTHRVIGFHTLEVHALGMQLRDLSDRGLKPIEGHGTPDELRPVIEALNTLIGKLDQAALAQRSFIANAAHQLRTPLTALILNAEQAMRCSDVASMRESVERLQAAAQRSARLANQLLLLSRAEPEAQAHSNRLLVDLHELAFEAAGDWIGRALASDMDLGFDEASEPTWVRVDSALVREALNNLIDNALKYCPRASHVTVSVRKTPEPHIAVEDDGPGIAPEDRPRVVERFYRGDKATGAGTGLGLSIVSEIANAHGGRLVISSSPQGGTRCEIFFRRE